MIRATILLCGIAAAPVARLVAQDPAQVEALAPLLMAEDRREFNPAALQQGLTHPDPVVRAAAALSAGRLGDPRGVPLLAGVLADSAGTVIANAFFALGLIRDTAAVEPIVARLRSPVALPPDAVSEAATALARIGGARAAAFIGGALSGATELSADRRAAFIPAALLDAWHLGTAMPAAAMGHYARDTSADLRWRSLYSLGRMRVAAAGRDLLDGLRDQVPVIRETCAKWLTRQYVDTARLPEGNARSELVRALDDPDAGVRVNALTSLATFADSSTATKVIPLLTDGDQNVRVAAATALGSIGGAQAGRALDGVFDRHDATWGLRRAALAALLRVDSTRFAVRVAPWLASADPLDRVAALAVIATRHGSNPAAIRAALTDPDVRVQAAALDAWRGADSDAAMAAAARDRLHATNVLLRAAAASALRPVATTADIDPLVAAWRQSLGDGDPDARVAILGTLRGLQRRVPTLLAMLAQPGRSDFLQRPADPVVRADAERTWPELARQWGPKWPIDTHRSLQDYRDIVRTYLLAATNPQVSIDIDGRGTITVELLPHDAPLTVANFLRLVDGHRFDGNRFHRVVPDFVVQDGDPTGTGNGGPGWTIRDEINRQRYLAPMLGMALSGPDTGGSQWFINLSPQPHLDGQYTIFGQVVGSYNALNRVVQGDRIRSIHR